MRFISDKIQSAATIPSSSGRQKHDTNSALMISQQADDKPDETIEVVSLLKNLTTHDESSQQATQSVFIATQSELDKKSIIPKCFALPVLMVNEDNSKPKVGLQRTFPLQQKRALDICDNNAATSDLSKRLRTAFEAFSPIPPRNDVSKEQKNIAMHKHRWPVQKSLLESIEEGSTEPNIKRVGSLESHVMQNSGVPKKMFRKFSPLDSLTSVPGDVLSSDARSTFPCSHSPRPYRHSHTSLSNPNVILNSVENSNDSSQDAQVYDFSHFSQDSNTSHGETELFSQHGKKINNFQQTTDSSSNQGTHHLSGDSTNNDLSFPTEFNQSLPFTDDQNVQQKGMSEPNGSRTSSIRWDRENDVKPSASVHESNTLGDKQCNESNTRGQLRNFLVDKYFSDYYKEMKTKNGFNQKCPYVLPSLSPGSLDLTSKAYTTAVTHTSVDTQDSQPEKNGYTPTRKTSGNKINMKKLYKKGPNCKNRRFFPVSSLPDQVHGDSNKDADHIVQELKRLTSSLHIDQVNMPMGCRKFVLSRPSRPVHLNIPDRGLEKDVQCIDDIPLAMLTSEVSPKVAMMSDQKGDSEITKATLQGSAVDVHVPWGHQISKRSVSSIMPSTIVPPPALKPVAMKSAGSHSCTNEKIDPSLMNSIANFTNKTPEKNQDASSQSLLLGPNQQTPAHSSTTVKNSDCMLDMNSKALIIGPDLETYAHSHDISVQSNLTQMESPSTPISAVSQYTKKMKSEGESHFSPVSTGLRSTQPCTNLAQISLAHHLVNSAHLHHDPMLIGHTHMPQSVLLENIQHVKSDSNLMEVSNKPTSTVQQNMCTGIAKDSQVTSTSASSVYPHKQAPDNSGFSSVNSGLSAKVTTCQKNNYPVNRGHTLLEPMNPDGLDCDKSHHSSVIHYASKLSDDSRIPTSESCAPFYVARNHVSDPPGRKTLTLESPWLTL